MVVFTCNNCGDSVNKSKVEKHIQYECKRKHFAVSFCCVDCLKDFNHETVKGHCQCLTEEQRYSAKGFVPKASAEKGKRKQAGWVDIVQSVMDRKDLPHDERQFLNIIAKFDNVPRKKNKFQNFCFSTAPAYRKKGYIVDKVFDMIEAEYKAQQTQNTIEKIANTNNTENLETSNLTQEETQDTEKKKSSEGDDKQVENTNNETGETPKKKKKKSKQSLIVNTETEINIEENAKPQSEKKKKKKEKKSLVNSITEGISEINDTISAEVQSGSDKKSKKKKNKSEVEVSNCVNENGTSKKEEINEENGENGILHDNTELKISKKEKKETKKKMKYQQELATVTNSVIEENKEPKSKKKKRKLNDNEENEEPQQKILKIEEKSEVPEVQSGRKFEWNEAIKQVLQSKKSKPISISKAMKRVMNEYKFLNDTTKKSESELEKIFLKKLKKMKNVVIDNDKVQLVELSN